MSGLNRKQRRASGVRNREAANRPRALPDSIRDHMEAIGILGGFANHVSMSQAGLPTTTGGSLASIVFAKCCAHARSILSISMQSSMFDHHAIMALSRMIMEASTMVAYLLDPVELDEWELRYILLKLHDTVTRIKLLRGFDLPDDDRLTGQKQQRLGRPIRLWTHALSAASAENHDTIFD